MRHFDLEGESLRVPSGKTGARTVILQPEAVAFFARLTGTRTKDQSLLARADGGAWGASHQVRPMKRALTGAGLDRVAPSTPSATHTFSAQSRQEFC